MGTDAVILMVGAFEPEIDLLREPLRGKRIKIGEVTVGFEIFVCGVGGMTAALNLQERLLDAGRPDVLEVIQIGSAGIYGEPLDGAQEMGIGFADIFLNMEIAVIEGEAVIPEIMRHRVETDPGPVVRQLSEGLKALLGAANSPDSITLKGPTPSWNLPEGCLYENLEGFGLAVASERSGRPFGALYAITNAVGPEGSAQWRESHRALSLDLQRRILEWLNDLSPPMI